MVFRITYANLSANLAEVHREFDHALETLGPKLGETFPAHVGWTPDKKGPLLEDRNPSDTNQLLARFHMTPVTDVPRMLELARTGQRAWAKLPWQERVRMVREAAAYIDDHQLEYSAIVTLEVGKSRLEALGDVAESSDLLRYYADQVEESGGYDRPMGKEGSNDKTRSVLRPYGVFLVISPFNFPAALSAGMSGAALLGGNSVILKPSEETPWSGQVLFDAFRAAGVPEGVFQLAQGHGEDLGAALAADPRVDGIAFTGSTQVGFHLMAAAARPPYVRPVLAEMGGKNPAIVTEAADLEKAVEGCFKSAFGLSGQKCSALSRIYVHESRRSEFLERLITRTKAAVVGDPTRRDVFTGPVINRDSVDRYHGALEQIGNGGGTLDFAVDLSSRDDLARGHFVPPTIASLPHEHRLMKQELFLPFVGVDSYRTLDEAIAKASDVPYGLTAGVYSEDPAQLEHFFDEMQAGVLYSNRRTGATTGAWPGVQSFCGWKASGSSGKGGCGPYYVMQFMREQSRTMGS